MSRLAWQLLEKPEMADETGGSTGTSQHTPAAKPSLPACSAVIVAAGQSRRMGGSNKLFVELAGRPLLYYSLAAFESCPSIDHVALVLSLDGAEPALDLLKREGFRKVDRTCMGGERRQDSVRAGIEALRACDWVVVHDAARPLVTPALIEAAIDGAQATGAAILAMPVVETLKRATGDREVLFTVEREGLWAAQTPQVFRYDVLLAAHEDQQVDATDDAALVERMGVKVRLVPGSAQNIKVTTPEDLALAEALVQLRGMRTPGMVSRSAVAGRRRPPVS